MAKTSEAGVMDSNNGSQTNVEDTEAALPANVAAPVVFFIFAPRKILKIRDYMMLAAMVLGVLWVYTTLLYIALPFGVSDSCARGELRVILSVVTSVMEILIMSLLFGARVLLR